MAETDVAQKLTDRLRAALASAYTEQRSHVVEALLTQLLVTKAAIAPEPEVNVEDFLLTMLAEYFELATALADRLQIPVDSILAEHREIVSHELPMTPPKVEHELGGKPVESVSSEIAAADRRLRTLATLYNEVRSTQQDMKRQLRDLHAKLQGLRNLQLDDGVLRDARIPRGITVRFFTPRAHVVVEAAVKRMVQSLGFQDD